MAGNRPRPFLETNVLFSGLYRAGSPPGIILEHHVSGKIGIVISRQVLEELIATVRIKKPDLLPPLQSFLTNAPPEICTDPTPDEVRQTMRWIGQADAPILAAAIKARVDCLVTGNTRHFGSQVAEASKLPILTPAQYLAGVKL